MFFRREVYGATENRRIIFRGTSSSTFAGRLFSVQHSILARRDLPDDNGYRRPFYDPSSEHPGIFGFEPESHCRNHFETVSFDDVSVSAAGAAANTIFNQNSAFEYRSDIRIYGCGENAEQVGDSALREPDSGGGRMNCYLSVLDRYGLRYHMRLFFIGSS